MVQASPTCCIYYDLREQSAGFKRFIVRTRPAPLLITVSHLRDLAFLTLCFTAKETGDLTAYCLRVGQLLWSRKAISTFLLGQYSLLTSQASSIIPLLPFGVTTNRRLCRTAPGSLAKFLKSLTHHQADQNQNGINTVKRPNHLSF